MNLDRCNIDEIALGGRDLVGEAPFAAKVVQDGDEAGRLRCHALPGEVVQIAGLRLDSAELDYILPQKPALEKTTPQPFSLYDLGKRIQAVVATLPEFSIPDLDFRVNSSSGFLPNPKRTDRRNHWLIA